MASGKNEKLEGVIAELRDLARRKPLPDEKIDIAKALMVRLREMGFTNREISDLTDGGWKEQTVKLYTRGSAVEDPSQKNNAIKLLKELVDRGLALDKIEEAISLSKGLGAKGLVVEDISGLLEDAKKINVDISGFFSMYKEMKARALTAEDVRNALAYKAVLESSGFTLDVLPKLSDASKLYGGFAKVMEAVDSYGGLDSLKAEIKKVASEKKKIEMEVENLKSIVGDLERRRAAADEALKTYDELMKKGFDVGTLQKLKDASSKYGGVDGVLTAVNKYGNFEDLEGNVSKLSEEKADVEAKLYRLNAEHAHLQTVVEMCDALLYKYRFSISSIEKMHELAKKYGGSLEVIGAIGRYGELKVLESEVEKILNKKGELEARVRELEEKVQELRGTANEIKLSISGLLKPLSDEFVKAIDSITSKFREAIDSMAKKHEELVVKYGEFSNRLGELKAEAGNLEEELLLARNIQALVRYPTEAKDLPLDYDLLMLKAIIHHCTAKGVNPKVKAGDLISDKYGFSILSSMEVELIDILKWAERGLTSSLGK